MNMLKEKKTLQHHQDWLIEKAKLTYLSFGKVFERETKMIEDQTEKKQAINEQVKGIKKQGKKLMILMFMTTKKIKWKVYYF